MADLILNEDGVCREPENEISYEFDSGNQAILKEILALLPRKKTEGEWVEKRLIELCKRSMEHKQTPERKIILASWKKMIKNSVQRIKSKSRNRFRNSDTRTFKLHPC